jgi:hypothetical protein
MPGGVASGYLPPHGQNLMAQEHTPIRRVSRRKQHAFIAPKFRCLPSSKRFGREKGPIFLKQSIRR